MANVLYLSAKEDFLAGNLNLSSNVVTLALIDSNEYSYSSNHSNWSDVPDAAIAAEANLSSQTITGGVFDAADVTFSAVTFGSNCEALILYHNRGLGANSSSELIAYIDNATGLPILPSGGDITVRFSSANTAIFSL